MYRTAKKIMCVALLLSSGVLYSSDSIELGLAHHTQEQKISSALTQARQRLTDSFDEHQKQLNTVQATHHSELQRKQCRLCCARFAGYTTLGLMLIADSICAVNIGNWAASFNTCH